MIFAGMDGCRAGWLLITFKAGQYDWKLIPHISQLPKTREVIRVFLDMPVGLSSKGFPRTIESKLRAELGNRSSTVFNAPARAAVYESNREKAKKLNLKIEGKSLSEQSLNIKPKILEVDRYLQNATHAVDLIESHPEICFKHLNGSILQTKKSTREGILERLKVLAVYDKRCTKLFDIIFKATLRKHVKADDIADALCLCLANRLNGEESLNLFQDLNTLDERGIPIQIGFFNPQQH